MKEIQLGKINKLEILRFTSIGVYLEGDILLPGKQVPEGAKEGDEVEVFIYKDSEDRIIATRKVPKITVDKMTALKVVDTTSIGAFLDWGLEKDLFLPYKEQAGRVVKGGKVFVALYVDKTGRLCATMRTLSLLRMDSPYKVSDQVTGTICSINKDLGAFVAVDNTFQGLIPNKELYGEFQTGDEVSLRVKKVYPDGKLELSVRQAAFREIDGDGEIILEELEKRGGSLNLNDKSDPELIKKELRMSKAAFKRAVGRLLKKGEIVLLEDKIQKK